MQPTLLSDANALSGVTDMPLSDLIRFVLHRKDEREPQALTMFYRQLAAFKTELQQDRAAIPERLSGIVDDLRRGR